MVDDWFDTDSLEDLEGNIQYGGFSGLGIATSSTLPYPGDIELAHAGSEETAKPGFQSRPGMEYKPREDRIQSRRRSWLQAP